MRRDPESVLDIFEEEYVLDTRILINHIAKSCGFPNKERFFFNLARHIIVIGMTVAIYTALQYFNAQLEFENTQIQKYCGILIANATNTPGFNFPINFTGVIK